jgi:hypothetical protein
MIREASAICRADGRLACRCRGLRDHPPPEARVGWLDCGPNHRRVTLINHYQRAILVLTSMLTNSNNDDCTPEWRNRSTNKGFAGVVHTKIATPNWKLFLNIWTIRWTSWAINCPTFFVFNSRVVNSGELRRDVSSGNRELRRNKIPVYLQWWQDNDTD